MIPFMKKPEITVDLFNIGVKQTLNEVLENQIKDRIDLELRIRKIETKLKMKTKWAKK